MKHMLQETKLQGIYEIRRRYADYYTKSLVPRLNEFECRTIKERGNEFRLWDPKRSKLCAALQKGINQINIKPESSVLYLGAAHGYTPSFVSDIIGEKGRLFALDFAPEVVRDLVLLAEKRPNMAAILSDAFHPETYKDIVFKVDVVYQDIAQRDQVTIFSRNCNMFLKSGGFGLLALKARSVDVTRKPKELFKEVRKQLEEEFIVVDYRELDPYEKDHAFFVIKKK